jgi:hypothetical protein
MRLFRMQRTCALGIVKSAWKSVKKISILNSLGFLLLNYEKEKRVPHLIYEFTAVKANNLVRAVGMMMAG